MTTKTRIDAETETLIPTIGGVFSYAVPTLDASYGRLQGCSGQDAGHGHGHLVPTVRSVALRGRDGGATAELGDDLAGALRASGGGGDKAHVLATLAFDCKASGMSGLGVGPIASTMRAMGHANSHQNGGGHMAVCTVGSREIAGALTSSYGKQPDGSDTALGPNLAICITGDITHTLKAEGFDASEDGTGRGQPIVTHAIQAGALRVNPNSGPDGVGVQADVAYTLEARSEVQCAQMGMAVRRLTPRECERLQGFPDDYTQIPFGSRKKLEAQMLLYIRLTRPELTMDEARKLAADGPRYKALGNSWAVPNVAWIGRRIAAELGRIA